MIEANFRDCDGICFTNTYETPLAFLKALRKVRGTFLDAQDYQRSFYITPATLDSYKSSINL